MTINRLQLYNDQEEAQRQILDGRQSQIWTAMPAIVTAVNLSQMTIECQPTIQGVVTDENGVQTFVNLPLLVNVPICFPSTKAFTITMPIAIGDEVLIVWACRGIDSWWQSSGVQKPIEARMHDLSDGFCIPGPRSIPNVVPNISSTDIQIRNNAGTSYIAITADGHIKLVSPEGITVTGNVNVTGTIIASGEITSGTIPLSTHLHPQTGGANTLGPIP